MTWEGMFTVAQGAILMPGLALAATIITLALIAAGDRWQEPGGRHARREDPPPEEPATQPILLRDRITISLPSPRRYTGGIPVLADTHPGRGPLPPREGKRWACSLCQDGGLPSPSRSGVCAWCGGRLGWDGGGLL